MVACSGLVAAGAELVAAGAGRWSLLQKGGHRCRTGFCWSRKVVAGSRLAAADICRCRTGSCFCREVVAGAGVVVAAGAVSKGIRLDFLN